MDQSKSEVLAERARDVTLWSRSGPPLLLSAFAIVLFREAPLFWPLILTAFLGYAATRLFRRAGLSLALATLVLASFFLFRTSSEWLWISLFTGSTALSFFLIHLGGKEVAWVEESREEKIDSLEDALEKLKSQLSEARTSLHQMDALLSETRATQTLAKQSLTAAEEEKQLLVDRCALLSQESIAHQNRSIALYHDLEDARGQLAALKEQSKTPSIIEQEDGADAEGALPQSQYAQLREQFEEKAEALHLARKELFQVESDYLALQRTEEEKDHHGPEEGPVLLQSMQELEEECRDLEAQVLCLQDLVTTLLTPKTRSRSRKEQAMKDDTGNDSRIAT